MCQPLAGAQVDIWHCDALTDRVHATAPYSSKEGQRLLNARDMIYREGGTQLMLPVVASGSRYSTTFRVAMRPGEPPARGLRGLRGRPLASSL